MLEKLLIWFRKGSKQTKISGKSFRTPPTIDILHLPDFNYKGSVDENLSDSADAKAGPPNRTYFNIKLRPLTGTIRAYT